MYQMERPVKGGRRYDSSRRREQAQENRARILAEAQRRFVEHGYAATTVPSIAADAGVSVETIYKAFANKAGLLKAVFDAAVVGDHEPVPVAERDEIKDLQAEPDARQKLHRYARLYTEGAQRAVPFELLARDAAATDPAAAEVWAQMANERLAGTTQFARHLADRGCLREGCNTEEARDVLWTFIAPEVWELLVVRRQWEPDRFATWMGRMLVAALLPVTSLD
jgi:AcrR family transcriptional regulator